MTGYFEFANPTRLCAGKGAIGNLAYELKMLQVMRPMILSDAASCQNRYVTYGAGCVKGSPDRP